MRCRQARQLLSPYIDDELGAREKERLQEHLAACSACRQELGELQGVSCILQDIGRQIKVPDDLVPRAMARIQEEIAKGNMAPLGSRTALAPAGLTGKVMAGARQDAGPQREPDCGENPAARRPAWTKYLAAAAAVAVLFGGTLALAWQYGPWGAPGSSVAMKEGPLTPPTVTEQSGSSEGTVTSPRETAAPELSSPEAGGPEGQPAAIPAPGNEGPGEADPGRQESMGDKEGTAGGEPVVSGAGVPAASAEPEATPEVAAGGGKSGVAAAGPVEAAAAPVENQPPRAFLSTSRHTRSTLLELGVDDLAAARQGVQALARGRGAQVSSATPVAPGEEIIRLVVPVEAADRLLAELAKLGRVLDKETQEKDVTAEFNKKLAEYQELAGQQSMTESDAGLLAALESQLAAWDKESVEAGKEVVTVWLKAGK